jgi:hypothetical protein
MHNVKRVVGAAAAKRMMEEVKKRIPASGGWYAIYRGALEAKESGDEWIVDGLQKVPFETVPANETLLSFVGTGKFAAILAPYNPWPIDLIPPIDKGYSDAPTTRAASHEQVETRRDYLVPVLDNIKTALKDAGASLEGDSGLLRINGDIYADIGYLAMRLEHGYHGFPHIPHWGIVMSRLRTDGGKWLTDGDIPRDVDKAISDGS